VLESCLQEAERRYGPINDSLVVLPEGFNLGRHYWERSGQTEKEAHSRIGIVDDLRARSRQSGCALVAGLIINDVPHVSPPYNSAFLIDSDDVRLLSRKHQNDFSVNYTPFDRYNSRPTVWRGVVIIGLICNDVELAAEKFKSQADEIVDSSPRIICVPMHMSNGLHGGLPRQRLMSQNEMRNAVWVAASSRSSGVNSFVAGFDGVIREPIGAGAITAIELFSLTNLL
jgi:predicted amidohydrolase